MFAQHQTDSFLFRFFSKKRMGFGATPHILQRFLFVSFFFCACGVKRKSGLWVRFCYELGRFFMFSHPAVSSWAEEISLCEIFAVEPDPREGAKRDLLWNFNVFRPRSQTILRIVWSSLRSDFDYAQDDTDEKAPSNAKVGSRAKGERCITFTYLQTKPMP